MRKYFPARTLLQEPSVSAAPASSPSPSAAAPTDHPSTYFFIHDASTASISPQTPEFDTNFSPSMAIIMVVLLTSFFFMGFFSVYLKRCTADRESSANNAAAARRRETTPEQGLDPAAVESLPMVIYSAVKKTREGKAITECSVCLTEFEDNQPLRLLPKCKHCFHPECIDMWLYTHTTCPLCRRSLVLESLGSFRWGWGSMRGSRLTRSEDIHGREPMEVATEGGGIAGIDQAGNLSQPREGVNSSARSWRRGPDLKDREPCRTHDSSIVSLRPSAGGTRFRSELRRSHSTGHSLVKRALSRASLFLPGSSSIDHPNDGQPLSSCIPLGASTSAGLHRSRSHEMLSSSNDDMQVIDESGVLAGRQDFSSSRRWNRSFSFKRAFSLRRSSQEAMASSWGELRSSSGVHRTFDRLVV